MRYDRREFGDSVILGIKFVYLEVAGFRGGLGVFLGGFILVGSFRFVFL